MKRDFARYGKILLIVLAPGAILLLLFMLGEGSPKSDWPFVGLYLALAGYLLLFGAVVIGLRFLAGKIGAWMRR